MKLVTRLFQLFGDVRRAEIGLVTRLLTSLFALMFGYYVLKTVREPMILATGGAELKAYAAGAQAAVLIFAVKGYDGLAGWLPRASLVRSVLLFFVACIVAFALAAWLRVPGLGFVFYVWVGIFSLATIAQFWSFANDLYSKGDGERLFPIIAIGQVTGAAAGSKLAEKLFEAELGIPLLLAVAAALVSLHLALYPLGRPREEDARDDAKRSEGSLRGDQAGGFRLVLQNRYLQLLATLLVLLNLVNTTGEYILSKVAVELAETKLAMQPQVDDPEQFLSSQIGAFYGEFFFQVNIAVMLLQAFVVSRLVRWLGFRAILFVLPTVALGAYGALGLGVSAVVFRWLKLAENSTDYSVMNTAKAMAWLPTTPAEKYKAKQAVDTFFVRAGDVLSAGLVFVGTELLAWTRTGFAWFNVCVVVVWIVLSVAIARRYHAPAHTEEAHPR